MITLDDISKASAEALAQIIVNHPKVAFSLGDLRAINRAIYPLMELIESSGEKTIEKGGKDVTQFIHPDGEIDWVKPRCSPAPLLKGEFERRYGKPAPSPGPSAPLPKEVEEAMTDEEAFRAIYALIEYAVDKVGGGYFTSMTDKAMKGYFHFLRHPALKAALSKQAPPIAPVRVTRAELRIWAHLLYSDRPEDVTEATIKFRSLGIAIAGGKDEKGVIVEDGEGKS